MCSLNMDGTLKQDRLPPRGNRENVKRLVLAVLLLLLLVQVAKVGRRHDEIARTFEVHCSSISAISGLSHAAGPIQSAIHREFFLSLPASKAGCLQPAPRWQEHECGLVEKIRLEDAQRRGLIPPVPETSRGLSTCFEPAALDQFGLLMVMRFDEGVWYYWYQAVW